MKLVDSRTRKRPSEDLVGLSRSSASSRRMLPWNQGMSFSHASEEDFLDVDEDEVIMLLTMLLEDELFREEDEDEDEEEDDYL